MAGSREHPTSARSDGRRPDIRAEPVGPVDLQGLGPVELFRIVPDVRA
jgi:hypothetical protein